MAMSTSLSRRIGARVKEIGSSGKGSSSWFTPRMAAARRAIFQRIPLVDFILEVRDARVPISSAFEPTERDSDVHKRIILLNKADLADHSQTEEWIKHFKGSSCMCYAVNSHNKGNIDGLLNFVRSRIQEMGVDESYTATFMLVGIPNVGKSAVVNAMHQSGRISASEKGKLKHAIVTSQPGDTKDIRSYKIASHPNIYVLDTPGVLSPEIHDLELGSKLALTGVISDSLLGEIELAQYFLAILNSGSEYKRWERLKEMVKDDSINMENTLLSSCSVKRKKKQYPSDHTQDFIVHDVRRNLYDTISSFKGNLEDESEMAELIETQFLALHKAFRVPIERGQHGCRVVATKLLNLYRTGRLGRYTLDHSPAPALT